MRWRFAHIEMRYSNLMSLVKGAMKSEEEESAHIKLGCEIQHIATYEVAVPARTLSSVLDQHSISKSFFLARFTSPKKLLYKLAKTTLHANARYGVLADFAQVFAISWDEFVKTACKFVKVFSALLLRFVNRADFLSLDVEGFELGVLKGIDFDSHRPTFMLIEARYRDEIDSFLKPLYKPVAQLSHHDVLYCLTRSR